MEEFIDLVNKVTNSNSIDAVYQHIMYNDHPNVTSILHNVSDNNGIRAHVYDVAIGDVVNRVHIVCDYIPNKPYKPFCIALIGDEVG